MESIDRVLGEVDRAWREYRVGSADRAALAADLRLDLEAAASDGVAPDTLIGPDVTGFAQRLADEAGVTRTPPEIPWAPVDEAGSTRTRVPAGEFGTGRARPDMSRLLGASVIGGALGLAVAIAIVLAVYPILVRLVDSPEVIRRLPIEVHVAFYFGLPAAIVVAGAVIAVRRRLSDLPRIHETARAMAVLLPLTGILITPVTMGFARLTGYSFAPAVILTEVGIVFASLAGAIVLARRWALRTPQPAGDRLANAGRS